jgi:[ribosomal protein S5]-alanine N-acetyltransferase
VILPETLETARLRLRPARLDDALAVFSGWASDPQATRYLSWRPYDDVALARAFLADAIAARHRGRRCLWSLERDESGEIIGQVDALLEGHRVYLGWVLARRHWGRGYMSEAVRAVVEASLGAPEIFRVWAVCDVDNPASARVMEKAGMDFEGRLRRFIVHPNLGPEPRDVLCYAKVR